MVQIYKRKSGEILVNTVTSGIQSANHVAALSTGGFVVIWSDTSGLGGDNSESGIKAQRFDADGAKVGGEILVNTAVAGFQGQSKVSGLHGGRFVVTWTNLNGDDGDGPDSGIKGQVLNADGTKSGTEFLINSTAPELQLTSAVTTLASGGFVVSWLDGSGLGGDPNNSIKMQMFDSAGAKVGGETLVNTVTAGGQASPTLTALASGGFAASWIGPGVVKCQIFDALGVKVGAEQQVNTTAASGVGTPSMAALDTGFVVAWSHSGGGGDSDGFDVSAQLFDAAGTKIGGEFRVNTAAAGDQRIPEVRTLPGGYFLVTWQGPGAGGSGIDVYGQVFTAAGEKAGAEFVINGVTSADQVGARIAVLPSGDIVLTWSDNSGAGGDADGFGVKMVILTLTTDGPTDLALSNATLSETTFNNVPVATLSATGALTTSFTYAILSDSTGGAFRIDGDQLVVEDNSLLDFESDPSAEVRIRATDLNGNSYEETMTLTITDIAIEARYSAGDEFRVNTDTAGFNGPASITVLASGAFLIVTDYFVFGGGSGTRGQFYDAGGAPVGGEFEIDLPNTGIFGVQTVALPSGGFLIVYEGANIDLGGGSNGFPIRARMFDADGAPVGSDFLVSTNNQGRQADPAVAVLESGGFVITWTRPHDEPGGSGDPFPSQTAAQMFDADGDRIGAEFRVNTGIEGSQILSQVAALPGGGFAVTWRDTVAGIERIEGQIFDADGVKVGGEFTLQSFATGGTSELAGYELTMLESGDLLVSWVRRFADYPVDIYEMQARFMDPNGNLDDPFYLIVATLGDDYQIAALPGGGFAMAFSSLDHIDPALDDVQTGGLIFNAAGERVNEGFYVPEWTLDEEANPRIAALESGDIVFAWSRTFLENNSFTSDVYARVFTFVSAGDTGVAQDDSLATDEATAIVAGDLFADNGSGADSDPDGPALTVGAVNGSAANVGIQIVLASGALLTVNADGTFAYNPNGAFGATPAANSGASNQPETDEFTYRLVGGGTASVTVTIAGLDGNDVVRGTPGADILDGGIGNDVLDGLAGGDVMVGRAGDDHYFVDNASDHAFEAAGEGSDRVFASVDYTLASGQSVEILSTTFHAGTAAISLGGNELDNIIYGNAGNNILYGKGGNDFIGGLGGDDSYYIDSAGDYVQEFAGGGFDRIFAGGDYTLYAGQEIEILSTDWHAGTAAINLGGNELNNIIYGNAGANILYGKGGNDFIGGLGGDDSYFIDSAGDYVQEFTGGGSDRIYAGGDYTLYTGQEVEILSTDHNAGTAAIALGGNELDNIIYGNDGNNILYGKEGNDTLMGLGGNDQFWFNTGLGATNVDTLYGFASGADKLVLFQGVFTALSSGSLAASAFVIGSAAGDADDRIVYNNATGALLYDADGNGGGAAVQFATLNGAPALAASDFMVI